MGSVGCSGVGRVLDSCFHCPAVGIYGVDFPNTWVPCPVLGGNGVDGVEWGQGGSWTYSSPSVPGGCGVYGAGWVPGCLGPPTPLLNVLSAVRGADGASSDVASLGLARAPVW